MDIASDIAIIILPYRLLLSLKLSLRHRFVVLAVFGIGIFLVFLGVWRIVLLFISKKTSSIWLNGIVAAQFGQIFGTSAVIAAILPALRLFFTREQRKDFTQDMERRRKGREEKIITDVGSSGDTTLFSTTYQPDEEGAISGRPANEKIVKEVSDAQAGERRSANPPSATSSQSNIVRRLSSLKGLKSFVRRESTAQKPSTNDTPSLPPEVSGTTPAHSRSHTPRSSMQTAGMYPLQVKLHQVIPDIGGETSPTIRRK
ncbi:hypothetical protein ABW19_dt0205840 [Dactylella cylindrospora]|nr:hypothetical protein ABW19_dt0205840 [Dactylella cylindrospora]